MRRVVFLGTSLTAGFGLSEGEDGAYPALIEDRIEAADLPYLVDNQGVSGETSAGGLRRIDWLLREPIDVLVIELGANDGLRGLDVEAMRDNIGQVIERTRARYPDAGIVILGMEAPPNLGPDYTSQFRAAYRELADQHDAAYLPFLLDGIAGEPRLNQSDGIHPTPQGQRMMAGLVWAVLEPLLRERVSREPVMPTGAGMPH
jgi:acyl-CoA thioesterase-1